MAIPSTGTISNQPPSQVAQYEQQLQDMTRASISGYGTLPDPQLATEALLTGAAPALTSTLAEGDPALQSALLSQPIGQSQFTQKGVSPPTALFNDPYSFDPKQYQQYQEQIDKAGIDNSFKGMKEAPMANIGWYNSILNGSPDTIKKWQQFLSNQGFYGTYDQNGKNFKKGEVNGYNTQDFQSGMKQWALAFFAPQALFSRNVAEITNAQQFLSVLGFDPTAIASQMSFNPQKRQQVIDGWLQAQGPGGNKLDALNTFANHFGADALPQQLNDLRGDSALGKIGDAIHHIIPFIGSSDQDKLNKLTPAEQELLAPSLQHQHDNSGFLGFMGNVLTAPAKALVTAGYFLGDATHGDLENPFDAGSKVRTQADAFVSNPMSTMFGEQFAKDHKWLSTFGNIAMNVLDDPITYIPFVGEAGMAEKLGKGAVEGADTATAAGKTIAQAAGRAQMTNLEKLTGGLISHRVGTARMQYFGPRTIAGSLKNKDLVQTLAKAFDPIASSQAEIARMFTDKNMTVGLAREVLSQFDPEKSGDITKLMALGKGGKSDEVLAFLRDHNNGYAHHLFDMSTMANRKQHEQILKNFDRIGNKGKALHIFHTAHMTDVPNLVNHELPQDVVKGTRDSAMAAGVAVKDIQEFEDKYWEARDFERGAVFKAFTTKIADRLDARFGEKDPEGKLIKGSGLEKIDKHRQQFRNGGREDKGSATVGYDLEHNPAKANAETSWRTHAPKFTGPNAEDLNNTSKVLRTAMAELESKYQATIDGATRALHPEGQLDTTLRDQALSDPAMKLETLMHTKRMKDLQGEFDKLKEQNANDLLESKVPAPVMPTQKYQWGHLPYTASEIMAYANPILRKTEAVQHQLGIDKAMNLWKALVLSKPSTTLRVLLGDETSRFHIHFLLNDPQTALAYMKHMVMVRGKKLDDIHLPEELALDYFGLSHQNIDHHIPMLAGAPGYKQALQHLITNHYAKTEGFKPWFVAVEKANKDGKDEVQAGVTAIHKWLKGDSEQARMMRKSRETVVEDKQVPLSDAQLKGLAATMDHSIRSFTNYDIGDPERMHLYNWIKSGNVNSKRLDKLLRSYSYKPEGEYMFPRIQGRPPAHIDGTGKLGQAVDWYHHNVTQAWVQHARARGFMFKVQMEQKRLEKFYTNADGQLEHSKEQIAKWATANATQWVKRNTYQGSRSAVGSELRSVAPFWGATANSNRFYLHTLMEHPEVAIPAAQGELAITQQQQSGGLRLQVPFMGKFLSKLGMSSGDSFTWEPFNALFLTREGFGGFVPGMGPVFNAGTQIFQGINPSLVAGLSQLPGMSYVAGGSPMLPWLENLISGAGMVTGALPHGFEAPIVGRQSGYYNKLIDQKEQQQEASYLQGGRKGPAPDVRQATADVGANRMITGAASFAAPAGLAAQDNIKAQIMDAEKVWDPNLSPADKQTFFAKYPEVADYFKYIDPHTPDQPISGKESKNDILAKSPWVLPYATGTGVSEVPGRATIADTQSQYKLDVEQGNIRTLDPTEYLTKVRTQEETTQAWDEFDRLQSTYQNFLQTSGVASTSTEATTWRKTNYDPYVQALERAYPTWGATFVKQTSKSQAGLAYASAPISSVSTMEMLPRNPALETKATVLWRATAVRIQQAQSALYQVIASRGSAYEKSLIQQGLQQQLDQFATQDATFASQLSRFRYSSVDDLITYNANNELLHSEGYPTNG